MKTLMGTLAILVLLAVPAAAQTHPCDQAYPSSGTAVAGSTVTLAACADSKDTNGNPTTITGWALYDNAARTTVTLTASGPASPISGLTNYQTSMTAPAAAGVHTYQLAEINSISEGPKGNPFVLTVTLPLTVPSAPVKTRVQ